MSCKYILIVCTHVHVTYIRRIRAVTVLLDMVAAVIYKRVYTKIYLRVYLFANINLLSDQLWRLFIYSKSIAAIKIVEIQDVI